jgi:subtilase family serine protease
MELKNATVPLAQLDATIATLNRDITNNTGITRFLITNKTESELRLIVFNRTQAFTHISNANRALNDKQYTTVRSESQKAGEIIESTTNTAKALQKRNSDPLTIVYENWIIFAVVGLIAILVLLFKPKRRRKKKVKKMDVKP